MDKRVNIILLHVIFGSISTQCCTLSNDNTTANCSGLGLRNITLDLPHTVINLDLSDNSIETVTNDVFKNLVNLRSINLDYNNITTLETRAFTGLEALEKLLLNRNKLKLDNNSFKAGVFKPLKNLKSLQLANNIQTCYETGTTELTRYPDIEFGYLRNLNNLSLDLYRFPVFGNGFKKMTSLERLRFGKCCIKKLKNTTFENLPTSIIEFNMTYCDKIRQNVEKNTLSPFKNLKVLNLRRTRMPLVTAMGLLYPLRNKSMDVIDFHHVNYYPIVNGHNTFSVILTEQMFANLKSICIKKLDISFNGIVEMLHNTLFSWGAHSKCLEHLILTGNAFHIKYEAEIDMLFLLTSHYLELNLEIFEYSYAPVEFTVRDFVQKQQPSGKINGSIYQSLSPDIFVGRPYKNCEYVNKNQALRLPPKLNTFRLSHVIAYIYFCNYSFSQNNLQTIDLSYSTVDNLFLSITGLGNVTYFDGSGIDFTKASPDALKSFPNVRNLVLQDAELDRVFMNPKSQNIFYYNSKISNLNIARNHLTDLPENLFQNMEHLETLNLSFNSLDKFPSHILDKEHLDVIDLSSNKIIGLSKEITDLLDAKHNMSIYLHGNAFICTCDYMHFIQWLFDTKIIFDNGGNYMCTLSNGTQTTTEAVRTQFHDIFSGCQSTFWLTFSIVSVCVFIVILIVSVICYRLRWRIMYFFYRHFHYGYKSIRNDDLTYTYDAFVAYSNADYRWICSTFREKLETVHSFRLCLHDLHFEAGLPIQQNIINSICNSRKVIIDATPEYLKSKWFEFEIEMANIEMLDRRYENGIIVIIRNGTKPSDLPDLLRRMWDRITCVLLEDDENEEIFFERIVSALDL